MLYVITGPPAAGKSTWVREHAEHGDIVIDYDRIAVALTTDDGNGHSHPDHIKTITRAARRAAIDTALPLADSHDVYLIHSTPGASTLTRYRSLGARIITIDPGRDIIADRIKTERPWQMQQVADQWYQQQNKPEPPKPKPQRKQSIARPPTTAQRGYDAQHQRMRKRYEPLVRSGQATCWRCDQPIDPEGPWDLGHDDIDRTKYNGPEHVKCNRGAPSRNRNNAADTSRAW
jgi:hypothetical protein